jgi:hypothetical protein
MFQKLTRRVPTVASRTYTTYKWPLVVTEADATTESFNNCGAVGHDQSSVQVGRQCYFFSPTKKEIATLRDLMEAIKTMADRPKPERLKFALQYKDIIFAQYNSLNEQQEFKKLVLDPECRETLALRREFDDVMFWKDDLTRECRQPTDEEWLKVAGSPPGPPAKITPGKH